MSTATPTQQQTATTNLGNWTNSASGKLPTQAQYNPTLLNLSQLAQVNPSYYGGAQVGPTSTYGGAQVSPAATYGGAQLGSTALLNPSQISSIVSGNSPDLSANATIQQILQGFQPEQQQQQAALNQQLAASGLSGGPAVAAQNQLNTQLTQALAPTIASAIQNSQANQLNQGQFASNALIQALTGNVGAVNTAQQQQAQLNQQAGLANQSAINSGNQLQANLLQQAGLANQSAVNSGNQLQAQLLQQAGLANADAANTANTANVGAYNTGLASNVSAQNAAQQNYLSQLQQQWLDQFSAFNSINDAALGAQNNIAVQGAENFGTPADVSSAYSGLGTALGSLYAPTARSASTVAA